MTADGESSSNKRPLGNTSFEQSPGASNSQNAKRPFTDLSYILGAIPDSTTITYGMLMSSLEYMFQGFENSMNARFDTLDSRLDLFQTGLDILEEKGSSIDIKAALHLRVEVILKRSDGRPSTEMFGHGAETCGRGVFCWCGESQPCLAASGSCHYQRSSPWRLKLGWKGPVWGR